MALDTSAAGAVLKNVYLGPIREQINQSSILLAKVEREEVETGGDQTIVPLHVGRNTSAGVGRAEGVALPTAGQQAYAKAVIPIKFTYGGIEVSGPVMKAARSSSYAFVRAVESEIKGATRDFRKAFNRQLMGDGRDVLAVLRTSLSAAGTADNAVQFNDGLLASGKGNNFTHLQSGILVDVYASNAVYNTAAVATGLTVTLQSTGSAAGETYATGKISSNITATAGAVFVPAGSWTAQMMGLDGIISTADPAILNGGLQGLPVASNSFWASQVFANGGTKRTLTLALMQAPLSAIAVNSDFMDKDVAFILSNVYMRDTYVGLLTSLKRFVNTMKLDGGFEGVEFNGIPVVVDTQAPRNQFSYIVPDALRIFRTSDVDWMDQDGAVLSRKAGYDVYQATLFHYGNLGVLHRNALGKLADITEA